MTLSVASLNNTDYFLSVLYNQGLGDIATGKRDCLQEIFVDKTIF